MSEIMRVLQYKSIMQNICTDQDTIDQLLNWGFFTAPASTKYHGAYEGGLFDHSLKVTESLFDLTCFNSLKWQRPESPYIVGMFHDLCKSDDYIWVQSDPIAVRENIQIQKDDGRYEYNSECLLKGHGDKSVMMLSTLTQLTLEEVMCIKYHMGAFTDKSEWNDYTRAVKLFPNVLWTHQADMFASQVMGV